eukprot:scaffold7099_cov281-Pinguiococcus_pyrenoidosus.AAC.31
MSHDGASFLRAKGSVAVCSTTNLSFCEGIPLDGCCGAKPWLAFACRGGALLAKAVTHWPRVWGLHSRAATAKDTTAMKMCKPTPKATRTSSGFPQVGMKSPRTAVCADTMMLMRIELTQRQALTTPRNTGFRSFCAQLLTT